VLLDRGKYTSRPKKGGAKRSPRPTDEDYREFYKIEVSESMYEAVNRYRKVVGKETIDRMIEGANKFNKKHIVCISSTYQGGGVAEMLNSLVPLFDDLGIDVGWRILHGSPDFFTVTKKFHNALQGEKINFSDLKRELYYETNRRFAKFTHLYHDMVIVHDPQPLPLIDFYQKNQPWVFRCHIDISQPNPLVWEYLGGFIGKYNHMVISQESYKKEDIPIPQSVIFPAIDPLSLKNRPIPENSMNKYLSKFGIYRDKPIIAQVSRFDKFKDPKGVLKIFNLVRRERECQLVLLGSMATDDPEGQKVYHDVLREREKNAFKDDVKIIVVDNDVLVNSLQRVADVIIQKSLKEGFGLVVSEALYKETPVVASNVGGIPHQIKDGVNGFLHDPYDVVGFAGSVLKILGDPELRSELGKNGKDHVRKNFLVTRLILDWFDLFERYLG
jgi:trehalose synthase